MNKVILIIMKVIITLIIVVLADFARKAKIPMATVVAGAVIIAVWVYKPSKKGANLDNQKLDKK